MSIYDKVFQPKRIELSNGKTVLKPASRLPVILLILLFLTVVSVKITRFDFVLLMKRGVEFFVILGKMCPPEISYSSKVWQPLFDTIKMSLIGTVVGAVTVIPFAMAASTNVVKNSFVVSALRLFLSIVRTLPTLITALIATYMFGLGTLAGTIATAIFTFAYMGKILYEEIETVDMGAFEAMEAVGATRIRAFFSAIMPQVLPSYISNGLFCFEGNVRYAAILGYVGAGGIGLILNEKIGWREYPSVGMILIMLFVTVFLIDTVSRICRRRLV